MNVSVVEGKKIGIIGVGNIGASILRGLLAADNGGGLNERIFISDVRKASLESFVGDSESRVVVCESNGEVAEQSDVTILAVKPNDVQRVVEEIAPFISGSKIIISVAAGVPTHAIESALGTGKKVIRVMPNIGVLVGESVTAICKGAYAGEEDVELAREIFSALGAVYSLKESDLDIVTGLSGSGIAFFAAVIEAMSEGGVYEGLPYDVALSISAQTALGAAKMILAGNEPSSITHRTASPGGTTIRGLRVMDTVGVKAALMEAVSEATKRARELSSSDKASSLKAR
ncbi:MAG: pyrroline-5-carboxylate reductase [Methanomicrobia archaeon]|nr:pyrroline-5-carboxylate reductase [Methanomicrobia archaeon]